jgi:hypothetical protein
MQDFFTIIEIARNRICNLMEKYQSIKNIPGIIRLLGSYGVKNLALRLQLA